MADAYFVIHNSDGETKVDTLTREELTKRLNEEYYGDAPQFLEELDKRSDTNYWLGAYLIIKGEIIIPKPVKVIEEYEL